MSTAANVGMRKVETKSIDERRDDYKSMAAQRKFNRDSRTLHAVVTVCVRNGRGDSASLNCYIRSMLSTADNAQVTRKRHGSETMFAARHAALWLWAIVVAGAVLRLIALAYKSFWIDEIASVAIARRTSPVFWHFLWHDEGNMAAYYVLLRPWLHFGYGEGTVRLLSVIPGVLSIPLMYVLGRRLFGRARGNARDVIVWR